MRNVLKKIGLTAITASLACFVVSCDEEESASFDYKYDGLTSVSSVELDLETARKIQQTGSIEDVAVAKAEPVPVAADTAEPAADDSLDMGMDMNTNTSSDPNGF